MQLFIALLCKSPELVSPMMHVMYTDGHAHMLLARIAHMHVLTCHWIQHGNDLM